jgi:hypothetical protein
LLNHPNIAAIHGLEESIGVTALVLDTAANDTVVFVFNFFDYLRKIAPGTKSRRASTTSL